MENRSTCPRELVVYECLGRGNRPPRGEPVSENYLGIWPEPPYYYLFFTRHDDPAMAEWLRGQDLLVLRDTYRMDYAQWQDVSREGVRVGPFFVHCGLSNPPPGDDNRESPMVIRLRPGVAFGSGLHPTTRGCLLALAELFETHPPRRVVDLGTGTGILAMACGRLGAAAVWALDCLPLAAKETWLNIRANGLEGAVHALVGDSLDCIAGTAELLVMNIEWPCLTKVLREQDWTRFPLTVLSGFLGSQCRSLERLIPAESEIVSRFDLEDWTTLTVRNKRS